MTEDSEGGVRRAVVLDFETEHTLRNHIAIIVGFCDLLLGDLEEGDARAGDVAEIRRAADAALRILKAAADDPDRGTSQE